jgi:hypothetical protein
MTAMTFATSMWPANYASNPASSTLMHGRFNKSSASGVSFFAFQDVITGTTGFLIIITIFLALSIDEVIEIDSPPVTNESVAGHLAKTLEQVLSLKEQVNSSQLAPGENRETLTRMIEELKRSIDRLSPSTTPDPRQMSVEEANLSRELRLESQKLLTRLDTLKKLLPDTTKEAAQAESRIAALESEVKDVENRLQQTIDRKNVLKLIPEKSSTSKEPVLIIVQKVHLQVQIFGGGPPKIINSNDELLNVMRSYPTTNHYAVLYFKPSGALRFQELTKELRTAGYEIGYDLISEDIELDTRREAR